MTTRALAAMRQAGLTLHEALDPAREVDFLRAPGIGRKTLDLLRSIARESAEADAVHFPVTIDAVQARELVKLVKQRTAMVELGIYQLTDLERTAIELCGQMLAHYPKLGDPQS